MYIDRAGLGLRQDRNLLARPDLAQTENGLESLDPFTFDTIRKHPTSLIGPPVDVPLTKAWAGSTGGLRIRHRSSAFDLDRRLILDQRGCLHRGHRQKIPADNLPVDLTRPRQLVQLGC